MRTVRCEPCPRIDKEDILRCPVRFDGTKPAMERKRIGVVAAYVEYCLTATKASKANIVDQNSTFQRRFARFVRVQYPAAPGKAVRHNFVKPDKAAGRAVIARDHVVEFLPRGLARFIVFNPLSLIRDTAGDRGQVAIIGRIGPQAVHIGGILRRDQPECQARPFDTGDSRDIHDSLRLLWLSSCDSRSEEQFSCHTRYYDSTPCFLPVGNSDLHILSSGEMWGALTIS